MIYAREAGWTHEVRFAFNDALTAYVEKFEHLRDETREVDAGRPPKKPKHTKRIPAHTEKELLAYLGINADDLKAQEVLRTAVTQEQWDAFVAGEAEDWDTEPETVGQARVLETG